MLRTSLRIHKIVPRLQLIQFLSSNAQDFIEEVVKYRCRGSMSKFLSSNAQDFIEDNVI